MSAAAAMTFLALLGLALPAALLLLLGVPSMIGRRLPEKAVGLLTGLLTGLSSAAFAGALVTGVAGGVATTVVALGDWFSAGDIAFAIDFLLDPVSLTFALAAAGISGMVAAFSHRYLHREEGYQRYFVLYAIFLTGMHLVVLAGSIEVLFAGWELIGISSALLVGFFHDRPAPVRNAFRVLVIYRLSDAAMLAAAILVHHLQGESSLAILFGLAAGDHGAPISTAEATAIGFLLLVAAAGKCAQLPFSGWLPRAMEGPTPSSAVYYGAVSVHAGAYLLLRAASILERSPLVCALLGLMGVSTAIYATLARRVQTDVKSSLAFASLTHVSMILVEIALGLHRLAFVHLLGNACLRLLQFLRAPSVLHDFHEARNAAGSRPARSPERLRYLPDRVGLWIYRTSLERGYLEDVIDRLAVTPFLILARAIDRFDRSVAGWCAGARGGVVEPPSRAAAPRAEAPRG